MRWTVGLGVGMLLGSPAAAADAAGGEPGPGTTGDAPLQIAQPLSRPDCDGDADDEELIVVCGRKNNRYRIDPTVLAATRAREARNAPRPDERTRLFKEKCSPVGGASCGENVLPVSAIAITAVAAVVKAIKGEDLRPMLRGGPSEYETYQAARAAEQAKAGTAAPAPK